MITDKLLQKTHLKLIESYLNSSRAKLFKNYEVFESSSCVQITTAKNYGFDCLRSLIECVDKKILSEEQHLYKQFKLFLQKNEDISSTNIRFDQKNKISCNEFLNIIEQLFEQSEIVKDEKDTLIAELPLVDTNFPVSAFSFKKSFLTKNSCNKSFLIFTNESKLIDLYEKI